jgi:hypothetical protein
MACPAHTPDRPKNLYLQGLDNQRRQNWDASGMAFRTCLDQALRRLHPEGKGTLARRIDSLPAEIGVTPSMKQWAHEIRALGNEAAHEDEPFDEALTKDLQSFTEVFYCTPSRYLECWLPGVRRPTNSSHRAGGAKRNSPRMQRRDE